MGYPFETIIIKRARVFVNEYKEAKREVVESGAFQAGCTGNR
jgi:hypothetical protein